MNMKRVYSSMRLWTILSAPKRADYMRKKHIFREMGTNVEIMSRKIPLYSNLICFHNNINVGSNVSFLTHDGLNIIFNNMDKDHPVNEVVGCIEIMDNVCIGAGAIIYNNVRIGPNAMVSAGSVVTKDVPPNSIVSGNPAKVVGSFDLLNRIRHGTHYYPNEMKPQMGKSVSFELEDYLWKEFIEKREKGEGK